MSKPLKVPYSPPELRVYGTLRELTLTSSGAAQDNAESCPSGLGCHVTGAKH